VRESDRIAVQLDDPCVHRFLDCLGVWNERERRPIQRRRDEQRLAGSRRKPAEPALDEIAQSGRHGKRLTWNGLAVGLEVRARELQREERVAGRRLVQLQKRGAGKLRSEPQVDELIDRADAERAESDPSQSLVPQRSEQLHRLGLLW